jgi:BolA protein
MSDASFPVTASIRDKLTKALHPLHLDVINESHMHNVPVNSETHFKVVVVSNHFDTVQHKTPLQRHRLVHSILKQELDEEGPVHALSIVAKTPKQWQESTTQQIEPSPSCRGGDGSLPPKNKNG